MDELLEAAKPAVIESLKKELTQGITYEARNEMSKMVQKHVTDWVKENIIPEITKTLIESKEGMISLGVKLAPVIVDEMVKSATETIKKNLESSWSRKEIFGKLLS